MANRSHHCVVHRPTRHEFRAMPGAFRIMLVEDHPVVRLGVKTVIDAQPDMEVVGEAETAADAVLLATRIVPDVVILALRLEGRLCGVEVCRELKNLPHAPVVLIYTSFNTSEDVASSFLSGADGFVYKGAESGRLLTSVRSTCTGKRVWVADATTHEHTSRLRRAVEESGLTPREREVLGFMLQHYTNSQIAKELYIELSTVKTHVSNILRKLDLSSRHQLFT
ncbi:MAG: response regulator [Propionibacteriales bacterium]|nr:response regulator [Propionibacteriales bacterium]